MTCKLTCGCFRRWLWKLMITELTTQMFVIDWLTNHKLKEADFKTIMTLTSLKGIWYKINANENKLIQRGLSSVILDIYILEEKSCLRGNKRFILHHNIKISVFMWKYSSGGSPPSSPHGGDKQPWMFVSTMFNLQWGLMLCVMNTVRYITAAPLCHLTQLHHSAGKWSPVTDAWHNYIVNNDALTCKQHFTVGAAQGGDLKVSGTSNGSSDKY